MSKPIKHQDGYKQLKQAMDKAMRERAAGVRRDPYGRPMKMEKPVVQPGQPKRQTLGQMFKPKFRDFGKNQG